MSYCSAELACGMHVRIDTLQVWLYVTSHAAHLDFQEDMEDLYGHIHFIGNAAVISPHKKTIHVTDLRRSNGDIANAVRRLPHPSHCQDLASIKNQAQTYNQLEPDQVANFHLLPLSDLIHVMFMVVRSGSTIVNRKLISLLHLIYL